MGVKFYFYKQNYNNDSYEKINEDIYHDFLTHCIVTDINVDVFYPENSDKYVQKEFYKWNFSLHNFYDDYIDYNLPCGFNFNRDNPVFIQVVEEINEQQEWSELVVIEIPDNIEYTITEYDSSSGEVIKEKHRVWY